MKKIFIISLNLFLISYNSTQAQFINIYYTGPNPKKFTVKVNSGVGQELQIGKNTINISDDAASINFYLFPNPQTQCLTPINRILTPGVLNYTLIVENHNDCSDDQLSFEVCNKTNCQNATNIINS